MVRHYYSSGYGKKILIPLYIHGVTLEFISYKSLFSGTQVDKGTLLLLENIRIPREGVVLDIGCGYGVIGITIAKLNPRLRVYMVDINPLAVKTARQNAIRNNVADRVVVLKGDMYEPVKNMLFKAIYTNPPLASGRETVETILLQAYNYLEENGFLQTVLAKGREYYLEKIKKRYNRVEWIKKKGYIVITAYKEQVKQ